MKKELRENVGDFWAIVKTRPYMQACEQLVNCLLAMQRFDEAVVRMEDMLRLNPNDNQGIRWVLLEWYCRLSRFDEASSLLERYSHDESCFILLTRICLWFQKSGQSPLLTEELQLPYSCDVNWEIDWRAINTWVHDSAHSHAVQPWVTMVCAPAEGVVRSHQITTERPTLATIERTLADAILNPMSGDPERPSSLMVRQLSHRLELQNTADAIHCDLKAGSTPMVDHVITTMEEHDKSARPEADALISAEGMVPETLGDFFKASTDFYKSRIYTRVRADQVVEIRCPALSEMTHWAVVMGQGGQEIGLMLFFDLKLVKKLLSGRLNKSDDSVKNMTGIGYSLSDKDQIHPGDVAAAEQFGWAVLSHDAWPSIYRIEKGELKDLTTEDLRMATVCIYAAIRCHQQSAGSLTVKIPLHDQTAEVMVRKLMV